jgi:Spy/CpxP family protein refolding chaperone
MKKSLAVLTVIGLLGFGFFAFAQNKPAPSPQAKPGQQAPGPNGPMQRLKAWLNLTPEQVTKLQDFRKANQEGQKAFQDQMKKLRDELGPLMKDSKSDQNKINGLIDQVAKLSADRIKRGYQNARNLEKIFTPDQLDKLKRVGGVLQGFGMGLRQGLGMRGAGQGRGFGQGPGMRGGMGRQGMGQMAPGMRGGMGMGPGRGMMNQPGAMNRMNRLRMLGQRIRMLKGFGFLWGLGW